MYVPSPHLIIKWEPRLIIPINPLTNNKTLFWTQAGLLIATSYKRVVIGERGPYVEFTSKDLDDMEHKLHVPAGQSNRINSSWAYYIEHRTVCPSNVMVYHQLKTVTYADYKIGLFYISPEDLYVNGQQVLQPEAQSQLHLW